MDPAHLLTDELDYEFTIRTLPPHEAGSVDRLRHRIRSEARGEYVPPLGEQVVTRNGVVKEFKLCDQKLIEVTRAVAQAEEAADDTAVSRAQSRVLHLIGRIERLHDRVPEDSNVERLLRRAEQLVTDVAESRNSLGAGEAAAVVEGINGDGDDLCSGERGAASRQSGTGGAVPRLSAASTVSLNPKARQHSGLSLHSGPSTLINIDPPLQNRPSVLFAGARTQLNDVFDQSSQDRCTSRNQSQQVSQPNSGGTHQLVPGALATQFDAAAQVMNPNVRGFFNNLVNADLTRTTDSSSNTHARSSASTGFQSQSSEIRRSSGMGHPANHTGGYNIHKWNLRFDGHGPIDANDFVFRIERQAQLYGVAHQALVIGVVELLSGKAEQWYWMYQRRTPNATWTEFRRDFLQRYAPNDDSDLEIRANIENRWQRPLESFNDFCLDIEAMAARMVRAMPEAELVEILRRNMLSSLYRALWQTQTRTIAELLQQCNAYEKMMRDSRRRDRMRNPAQVNELKLEADELQYDDHRFQRQQPMQMQGQGQLQQQQMQSYEQQGQQLVPFPSQMQNLEGESEQGHWVDAIEGQRAAAQRDYVVCWNCKDLGHTFGQCPQPQSSIFCFSCGRQDVISINCPKCSLNGRRGRLQAEAARSSPQIQQSQALQQSAQQQNPAQVNKFRSQNPAQPRQSQ